MSKKRKGQKNKSKKSKSQHKKSNNQADIVELHINIGTASDALPIEDDIEVNNRK